MSPAINKKQPFQNPELSIEDLSSALYETTIRLAESNQKLQQSEILRSELIANLSHDFRSPVASLQGQLEYLIDFHPIAPEETITILRQMKNKIGILNKMMNEFFCFSSLEYTEQRYEFQEVNAFIFLSDFFQDRVLDPQYSERNLQFDFDESIKSYTLNLDIHWFTLLLDNLFENALKFTNPKDRILFSAALFNTELQLTVADTGIGIEPEHLPNLFERTYKASPSRTPGMQSGCGLGLSIARKITDLHNGKIWCESVPGTGSSFFIQIPATKL